MGFQVGEKFLPIDPESLLLERSLAPGMVQREVRRDESLVLVIYGQVWISLPCQSIVTERFLRQAEMTEMTRRMCR
jgi:hypothetical protein